MTELYNFLDILPLEANIIITFRYPKEMRALNIHTYAGTVKDAFVNILIFNFLMYSAEYSKEGDYYVICAEMKEECIIH